MVNEPLKIMLMETVRVEEFGESCLKLWMSQSWFSLGFLSQKFSLEFHGYKGIYSSVREESEKSFLCKTGHSGDSVS